MSDANPQISHTDGTLCREGSKSVPENFVACCEDFDDHTSTCEFDVRYEWCVEEKVWSIAIAESAGGGGILIDFCPHCGVRLIP
jgi:hypothetical protein